MAAKNEGQTISLNLVVAVVAAIALSMVMIIGMVILNNTIIQHLLERHSVTLCILLEQPENRTERVIRNCIDNPPVLKDLPERATAVE